MKTLAVEIKNVETDTVLHTTQIERTGTLQGNWEAIMTWAASCGHPVEKRFGSSLSGKAQDGILVHVEV